MRCPLWRRRPRSRRPPAEEPESPAEEPPPDARRRSARSMPPATSAARRLPRARGRAGRHAPRGRCRRQPLQRRHHEPSAGERTGRTRRGRHRTRRDSRRPRAGRLRAPARGDGAREDTALLVCGRARRGDPRRDAALRLRRERGGERASAGGDRDGRAGLVRPAHHDNAEQAEARVERGAWAARTALEMADVFAQLRAAASRRRR